VGAAFAIWMTGLPASGKSTITRALVQKLAGRQVSVAVLESDSLRQALTPRPTYSEEDREAFYRTMTYIGRVLVAHGVPVVFDATANRRAYRAGARAAIERFVEVYVACPLEVCMSRDPKGLYQKARSGQASTVPGMQAPYEAPEPPDIVVPGYGTSPDSDADTIVSALENMGFLTHRLPIAPP